MKRIVRITFVAGIMLATLAYFTEMNNWAAIPASRTIGFIGYIFIISAAAWFSLELLYRWGKVKKS